MKELQDLYEQLRDGNLTEDAHRRFLLLMAMPENELQAKAILHAIAAADPFHEGATLAPAELAVLRESIFLADAAMKEDTSAKPVYYIRWWRTWWAAAAVVLLLGIGTYIWNSGTQHPVVVTNANNIQPGHEGAILTLADGSQVSLDTISNGIVAMQGGAAARVMNGSLYYEGNGSQMIYNTMTTPKGRQYQLTLPDGTKVWLNNASSIRYPVAFNGKDRTVSIKGEAYFEVAENAAMPFRVEVDERAEVKVLGTHFNINAYNDEAHINTTLLEGAVQVKTIRGTTQTITLKPAQQAQLNAEEIKVIDNVNMERVIAWKNGLFYFEGATMAEIMRQVARWYDIDVVYEKGIPDIEFEGGMTRDVSLGGLLITLEKLGVHYKLEGRKLVILP